jgi:hypothetical protein
MKFQCNAAMEGTTGCATITSSHQWPQHHRMRISVAGPTNRPQARCTVIGAGINRISPFRDLIPQGNDISRVELRDGNLTTRADLLTNVGG